MSVQQQVLDAIAEGATTAAAIIEATGLEQNQVYQSTFILKKAGTIAKGSDGFIVVGAEAAPETAPAQPEVRAPAKRAKVKRGRKRASAQRQRAAPAAAVPELEPVSYARFGDYLVVKRQDVVDLLLTLERWRQMVEAVA